MKSAILLLLIRFFAALPLALLHRLGDALGWLFYRLPNRECAAARVNIGLCFPELTSEQKDRLLRSTLRENGRTLLEMPAAWQRPPQEWFPLMEHGTAVDEMRTLLAQKRGLIVAAPHLGNWEIGVHLMSTLAPVTILYRPPRQAFLEDVLVRGRSRVGGKLVPTTRQGIKALYQALERGEMVAILPDQQPKKKGGAGAVFAPFFGVPALTMTLVNRLARKSGAPVYFPFAARASDGNRYQVHGVQAPESIAAADSVVAATTLNQCVEACVRLYPEQYQWTYRRFDARPDGGKSPYKKT